MSACPSDDPNAWDLHARPNVIPISPFQPLNNSPDHLLHVATRIEQAAHQFYKDVYAAVALHTSVVASPEGAPRSASVAGRPDRGAAAPSECWGCDVAVRSDVVAGATCTMPVSWQATITAGGRGEVLSLPLPAPAAPVERTATSTDAISVNAADVVRLIITSTSIVDVFRRLDDGA